ncbi:hypothetical protein cce_4566 [Crocosphaera subtropica ATCC 51142]|uniref:Uncharacterized protein n=1 Tax=Crocosphaera subtropica (strain ATCC 51142 / BH68) TaxID=43989 RepID=B1WVC4_CROS5|nr:hypothetical protein [Crocosphaera subtropica]ACB53914.1 hypothetical protein cce_4566 [Crocosphaera subtropica ATCC 51142]
MSIFNKLKATVQDSKQILKGILKDYIVFSSETKQLTLKRQTVLLLCQQAVSRVEQLKNLEPHSSEGIIATVEYKEIQVKLHFTPEKIILHEDSIEGQLRLLTSPEFQTDSIIYRYLIAGWKTFLGGKIPNDKLPEGVRVEEDKVYYTFPRNQLQVIEALFSSLEHDSALITTLRQGDLMIESSVTLNWNDFNLQKLWSFLNL